MKEEIYTQENFDKLSEILLRERGLREAKLRVHEMCRTLSPLRLLANRKYKTKFLSALTFTWWSWGSTEV